MFLLENEADQAGLLSNNQHAYEKQYAISIGHSEGKK